jgi:hypothetical protein
LQYNKHYRAICPKKERKIFFLDLKMTPIHFIHIKMQQYYCKYLKIEFQINKTSKIAPQFRKVLYKWTPQEAKLLHGLNNHFSSLEIQSRHEDYSATYQTVYGAVKLGMLQWEENHFG